MADTTSLLIAAFMSLLMGVLMCFFGYAVYRSFIWVYGFLFGASLGSVLARVLFPDAAQAVLFAGAIIGGLFFGWLCSALHALPIILMGIFTGIFFAARILMPPGVNPDRLLILIFAVIGAVIAYAIRRYVVIAWTGIIGASSIVNGLLLFVPGVASAAAVKRGDVFLSSSYQVNQGLAILSFIVFAALSIGGIVFQYWNTKELIYTEKHFDR